MIFWKIWLIMGAISTVLESIRAKAKTLGRKIVLTESDDTRNLIAAQLLVEKGYAKPVLVGDSDAIYALAKENNISLEGVEVVDVEKTPNLQKYIDLLSAHKISENGREVEKYQNFRITFALQLDTFIKAHSQSHSLTVYYLLIINLTYGVLL